MRGLWSLWKCRINFLEVVKKNEYGTYTVEIDFEKSNYKAINYNKDRVPEVFKEICVPR